MSAYICSPEHIGMLAAYAARTTCIIPEWRLPNKTNQVEHFAQEVAKKLVRENIRSVAYLYPNDTDGARPGPQMSDANIEKAAALYALHFVTEKISLPALHIIKMCECYEYQCCETKDWDSIKACQQAAWIKGTAISELYGYNDAPWEFNLDIQLPDVELLYAEAI